MPSYLERYLAGETKQVWDEISLLIYANQPEAVQNDIKQVCQETMRRVRHNAETIIKVLDSIGFQFGLYPDQTDLSCFAEAITTPDPKLQEKRQLIESQAGEMPLTLRSFWEEMGSICLIGYCANWPEEADPLVVDSIEASLDELLDWQEYVKEEDEEEVMPYRVVISPDASHKDNISGGDWYGIELPCSTVDGKVTEEPHDTTFVDYLRIAFRAKGFPGAKSLPEDFNKLLPELMEF